jgi:electron transfer flavoprotein alpha subunit
MGLRKVWVYGEAADGKVASITLEILTKAREIADTVEVVYANGDADAIAGVFGEYGATAVQAVGDLGGGLAGPAVAAAIAAAIEAGNGPDAVIFGTTYDGRDVAGRLSAKIPAPVITNIVDIELDGDGAVGTDRSSAARSTSRRRSPPPSRRSCWCDRSPSRRSTPVAARPRCSL